MNFKAKTYWLIGASDGLGRALASVLSNEGANVILSARNKDGLSEIASNLPNATALPIDVTSMDSIVFAAKSVGEIDGIIYLAGAYTPMHSQEWDTEKALQMFDVNLLGAVRVLGEVLPKMIKRNSGHITLIGSLSAYQGLPGVIGYGASKAGLMHLAQNLYCDLQSTEIKVQIINPGFIKTKLTNKNNFKMPQIMTPDKAALHSFHAMKSKRFHTAFPKPFAWVFTLGKLSPYWLYAKFFRSE